MWWWNGYWPMPYFGPVFIIVMLFACGVMMTFMMRGHSGRHDDRAAQILKERLARGEIDKAEYEERRRLLDA